jgi:hypothetical protein
MPSLFTQHKQLWTQVDLTIGLHMMADMKLHHCRESKPSCQARSTKYINVQMNVYKFNRHNSLLLILCMTLVLASDTHYSHKVSSKQHRESINIPTVCRPNQEARTKYIFRTYFAIDKCTRKIWLNDAPRSLAHNKRPYLYKPAHRQTVCCLSKNISVRCPPLAWQTFWRLVSIAVHAVCRSLR